MTRKAITTNAAPAAIGPYSQAVLAGNTLYISGQLGIDPATGKLADGGVAAQARQALKNTLAILAAAGFTPDHVVQVQIFLTDIADFADVNAVYKDAFTEPFPARAAFAVAALPAAAAVEILAVAVKND